MSIRSAVSEQWIAVLANYSAEQQQLILDEAEHLANGIQWRNPGARISTNGALEVMFKTALVIGEIENAESRKGNHGR